MAEKGKVKKPQRIRLKLYGNPVKLDATIKSMAPDGSWIVVEFDEGTLGQVTLYPHGSSSSSLMSDNPNWKSTVGVSARLFEVL